MNTRAIEPRNFWGLVKQVGPWKTTSVDQTHLAQGYDSPHNNVQFVSPYQQDGTATIPDQQYTRKVIVEPHEAEEFRNGRIRKVPRGWDINSLTIDEPGFVGINARTDNRDNIKPNLTDADIEMDVGKKLRVDTTNLIHKMTMEPEKSLTDDFKDTQDTAMDENDSGNVTPKMDSNFLNTSNPIVQDIQQVAISDKQDFRTGVAMNSWTQPVNQLSTSHSASPDVLVKRLAKRNVELSDPAKPDIKPRQQQKIKPRHKETIQDVNELLLKRIATNRSPIKKKSKKDTSTAKVLKRGTVSV